MHHMRRVNMLRSVAQVAAVCSACVVATDPDHRSTLRGVTDAACGSIRVDPTTQSFIDGCNRERVFRGVNVVNKAPPYFPSPTEFEAGNSITAADMAMWRSLGFSIVRLGVLWSGVQPSPGGAANGTYLGILANISASLLADAGVYTLVDAHQDLFSPLFCADGAPSWLAAQFPNANTFPVPLTAAPITNGSACALGFPWATYYFTVAVGSAFQALYTNASYTAPFLAFWRDVVTAFGAAGDAVHAYELQNEPWPGDVLSDPLLLVPGVADKSNLQPMYESLAGVIRAAEAAAGISPKVIATEGITFDDFLPVGFTALPGAGPTASLGALSYHYYIAPNLDVDWQIAARVADAQRLRGAAFLTEFDIEIDAPWEANNATMLRHTLDVADAHRQSYIGWAYGDMWAPNGSLSADTAFELARPAPLAVAGRIGGYTFQWPNASAPPLFTLTYAHDLSIAAPTVLFVSTAWHFTSNFTVYVASSPPAPLTYSVQWFPGDVRDTSTAAADGAEPPIAYAFAYVYVTANAPAPGMNVTTATVTIRGR